jgi:hypothetical protein
MVRRRRTLIVRVMMTAIGLNWKVIIVMMRLLVTRVAWGVRRRAPRRTARAAHGVGAGRILGGRTRIIPPWTPVAIAIAATISATTSSSRGIPTSSSREISPWWFVSGIIFIPLMIMLMIWGWMGVLWRRRLGIVIERGMMMLLLRMLPKML